MRHAIAPYHAPGGEPQDLQVKPERLAAKVLLVEFDLARFRDVIAAVDLCPARDAWAECIDPSGLAGSDQFVLVEQGRAGADQAHIALED